MPSSSSALPILLCGLCCILQQGRYGGAVHSFVLPLARTSSSSSSRKAQVQNSYYASAGAPAVDMSAYDLPLDRTIDEWTAVVQAPSSLQEGGVFLRAKNKELFVDTLQYSIRRAGGLGLILTEIAGGREDGIGITIIEEVLGDGNSARVGLVPGDSIVALSVSTTSRNGDVETTRVSTECLGYDATIDAITSLPPPTSDDDAVTLTVKRVRRQPKINVRLQYPPDTDEEDVTIELFAGENLRRAMLTRGIKLNDRLAERFDSGGSGDCGSDGTCATCVVGVVKGMELLSPMGQQEGQILSKKPRWRMACKAVVGYGMVEGDMTLQVNPRQW
ncbi:hypothetical protein ACHAW5_008569 [Stephanodiscus triporus]|uniref:PDZ domain-containing protein n=1 Tax=Stephanodiscus triporus TaxID=2934178 RepID=A0ABD3MU29_9STRA